jgi:aspartate carbamoyltransferase catalytic subunit
MAFVSPPSLAMPRHVREILEERDIRFTEGEHVEDFMQDLDILYVTRLQKERFPDPLEFERVRGAYVVQPGLLVGAKPTMRILHPLPRVGEISRDVDRTPHAFYFEQAALGVPVRQALLALVLGAV